MTMAYTNVPFKTPDILKQGMRDKCLLQYHRHNTEKYDHPALLWMCTTSWLVVLSNPPRDHPRTSPQNLCTLITISRAIPAARVSR